MRVITFARIREFTANYLDADIALREWYTKVGQCKWSCFADVKNAFNSVDSVGNNRFVFNIKGNTYRLVAIIIFASMKVYIRFIGTHSQYEKIDCSNI